MTRKKSSNSGNAVVCCLSAECNVSLLCRVAEHLTLQAYIENYGLSWNIWGYGRLSRQRCAIRACRLFAASCIVQTEWQFMDSSCFMDSVGRRWRNCETE